jgi:hypothetical protein
VEFDLDHYKKLFLAFHQLEKCYSIPVENERNHQLELYQLSIFDHPEPQNHAALKFELLLDPGHYYSE